MAELCRFAAKAGGDAGPAGLFSNRLPAGPGRDAAATSGLDLFHCPPYYEYD
jgi:hypothetical protein